MERQGLVDLRSVDPTIQVSLMYGRADNFTGQVLYTELHTAYLLPSTAAALKRAQTELKRLRPDLSLKVYDAARPMSVQQKMFNVVAGTPKSIYVSNPANGGGLHNYVCWGGPYGCFKNSCSKLTCDTIPMGTKIDYMGRLSHVNLEQEFLKQKRISPAAVANRRLLRRVMAVGGFKVLRTEWWHFNFKTRAQAKAHYKLIR